MGDLFSSSQTTNSTKRTQVPGNVQQVYDQVLSMGQQAANQPFQPYDLQRIADFSPEEQQALNRLSGEQGMYDPLLQAAALSQMDMVGQGGVPTQSDLDQFMNPYTHNVIDYAMNGLNNTYETQLSQLGAKAGMSGAFGGSRQGVEEANLGTGFQQNAGSLYYGGMKDNFDQAMSNWFNSQNLRQSENINASNLAIGAANYNNNNANALSNLGGIKRGVNQANLDFAYQQFEQQQAYPWQQTGNLANIAYNYPRDIFTQTTNQTTSTQPSLGSIIMGGAMMAAGAMSGDPAAAAQGANTMKSAYDVGNTSSIPFAQASYQSAYNPPIQSPYTTQATPGKKAGGLIKGYKKGGKVKRFDDGGGVSSGNFGNSGNGAMGGSLIPGILGGVIPGLGSLKGTPSGPKKTQQQRTPATFDSNAAGWNMDIQGFLANKYNLQNPYGGYKPPVTNSTPPFNLPQDTSGMPGDFRNPQAMLRNQLMQNFARSNQIGNGMPQVSQQYRKGGKVKKYKGGGQAKQDDTSYTNRDVVNGLVGRGFSPEEASVIAGNMFGESSYNTKAIGDNGKSLGLMQWKGARRKALEQMAGDRNVDPTDFNVQLDHAASELRGPEQNNFLRAMREGKNLEDKTGLFMKYVERPSDTSDGNRTRRTRAAQDAFNQYHTVQGATPSGPARPPMFTARQRVGDNALSGSLLDYASSIPFDYNLNSRPVVPGDRRTVQPRDRVGEGDVIARIGEAGLGGLGMLANGVGEGLASLMAPRWATDDQPSWDDQETQKELFRRQDMAAALARKKRAGVPTNNIQGNDVFGPTNYGGYNTGKAPKNYLNSLILGGQRQQAAPPAAIDFEQDRSGPPVEIPRLTNDLQMLVPYLAQNGNVMPRRKPAQPQNDPIASLIRQTSQNGDDDEARRIARYLKVHPEMIGQHIPEGSYKQGGYVKKYAGPQGSYVYPTQSWNSDQWNDPSNDPLGGLSQFLNVPLPESGNSSRGVDMANTAANWLTMPFRALGDLGLASVEAPGATVDALSQPASKPIFFGTAEHGAPQVLDTFPGAPSAPGTPAGPGITNSPNLPQAQDPEDDLNNSIRQLLNRNVKDMLDNGQEKTDGPFLGLFPNANEPLMKFGLNLLANSDMNFGTALGRAGLATAQDQSQTRMENMKERDNQIKDLVQTQYMRNLSRGMDPKDRASLALLQGQMKIQQQENAAKIKERLMRLAIQLDPSKQFMMKLLEDQNNQDEDLSQ